MYKNSKIFSLLSVVFLMLLSCANSASIKEKSTDILSISYRRTVGRGGSEVILATKDSLISNASGRLAENLPNVNQKIKSADWQKLVSTVNMETLKKQSVVKVVDITMGQMSFMKLKLQIKHFHW